MSETLKRDFYVVCPIWYWPVLWWHFVIMEQYLADLYAATGRTDMTYGLALGPRGQLRLVFLSDTAHHFATHGHMPVDPWNMSRKRLLKTLRTNYPCNEFAEQYDLAPKCATAPSSQFYLDPG